MIEKNRPPSASAWDAVFSGATGLWLALGLLKFGNPVILDRQIQAPNSLFEALMYPWPAAWGGVMVAGILVLSVRFWSWRTPMPGWLIVLPLTWFVWQCLSTLNSVEPAVSSPILRHFGTCVATFYVGLFAFSHVTNPRPFWLALIGGGTAVLLVGWKQHFGGLEAARDYFFGLPNWRDYGPEFVEKVSSNRIYGTLVYPNALAGVILLLLPAMVTKLHEVTRAWGTVAAAALGLGMGSLGLACLWWSGSKAGWLILSGMAAITFLRFTRQTRIQLAAFLVVLAILLAAFWVRYGDYFSRGATSISARVGYWQTAWRCLQSHPVFGSGPGTFMLVYRSQKEPGMEMTRLAHNDFLQQGSDSGWPGMLTYCGWCIGGLALLYRNSKASHLDFSLWLGLTAITAQACMEFWLYIPAVAWTVFFLLGWRLGLPPGNEIDNPSPHR